MDPAKFGLDKVDWPPLKRFTVIRTDVLSTSLCQSEQLLCGLELVVEMLAPYSLSGLQSTVIN